MDELTVEDPQTHLQAYLNCLELCSALHKQTDEPSVRRSLDSLIDDLQELVASLASHLRQRGVAPGTYELDGEGKARIREMLGTRSLQDQLLVVRECLAELLAFYDMHAAADQADPGALDWPASLPAHTRRVLEKWDQHLRKLKAAAF
jgi:hypothetical protein